MTARVRSESEVLLGSRVPVASADLRGHGFAARQEVGRRAAIGKQYSVRGPSGRRVVISHQQANLMACILETVDEESYGRELAGLTGSSSGSVSKALNRLAELGFVSLREEDDDIAEAEGRPRRKLFAITAEGEKQLARWRADELRSSAASRLLA